MEVKQNNLQRQFEIHKEEYETKALDVLRSGWYILGKECELFEQEWAKYIGTKYCIGLASGLDALWMSFRLLNIGEGDEVIVCANAYIACVMGITINRATPVFVDCDEYHNINEELIESAITDKTKALLVVHLFGQACNMTKIMGIAKKYNLKVVEDCAQSHGNTWNGQKVGSFGDVSCFSFYPTKGLGAFGDAGCIITNDEEIARKCKVFRNYGSEKRYYNEMVGSNSRLDELQAGLLRVKLKHLDELNKERNDIANCYLNGINNKRIELPTIRNGADSSWHQFVIECEDRDLLVEYLKTREIGSLIHYPIPPYLQKAYAYLNIKPDSFRETEKQANRVLSLPMYNGMTKEEINYVINAINGF